MASAEVRVASTQDVQELCARLLAFNRKASGFGFDESPLQLASHDAEGRLVAGLLGEICAGWLTLHVVWVDPDNRSHGLGSQLLLQAEQQAKAAGAHGVLLDTFDWQAEGFYLRHGYEVFGRLADFPLGHERIYLRKKL